MDEQNYPEILKTNLISLIVQMKKIGIEDLVNL